MNDEFRRNKAVGLGYNIDSGEMPERLNGTVSKIVVGATPPWVRIPLSPPVRKWLAPTPKFGVGGRRRAMTTYWE